MIAVKNGAFFLSETWEATHSGTRSLRPQECIENIPRLDKPHV